MMTKLSFALVSAAFGVAVFVGAVAGGPSRAHAQEAYVPDAAVSDTQAQVAQSLFSCLTESLPLESCIATAQAEQASEADRPAGDTAQDSSPVDNDAAIDYGIAAIQVEVSQSITVAAPGFVAEDKDDPLDVASITIDAGSPEVEQSDGAAGEPPDTDATPLEVNPLVEESPTPPVEN